MNRVAPLLAFFGLLAFVEPARAQYTHSGKTTINQVEDVTSSANTGSLIIGSTSGAQVALDNNEIQARSAGGGTTTLYLQAEGGDLRLGAAGSRLTIDALSMRTNRTAYSFWIDGANPLFIHRPSSAEMHATFDVDQLISWGLLVLHDGLGMWSPSTYSGSATACWSSSGTVRFLGMCSSARRLKSNIVPLQSGLELVLKMNPVSFTWRSSGQADLGFVAEEAAAILPTLMIADESGNPHSFNYRHYTAVLTKAVQEQQAAIEELREQLRQSALTVSTLQSEVLRHQRQLQELTTATPPTR